MADLNGADFRATVRLSNQSDDTLALPGESCAKVPSESLGWLLEQGLIAPVEHPTVPSEVQA